MSTNKNPDIKNSCTTRLSPFLEGLNSSLAQSAGKLWPLAKMATGYLLHDFNFYSIFGL